MNMFIFRFIPLSDKLHAALLSCETGWGQASPAMARLSVFEYVTKRYPGYQITAKGVEYLREYRRVMYPAVGADSRMQQAMEDE